MGPEAMIVVFCMFSIKSAFSLSSFTFMKRLLSSSSLQAIRGVSSAYVKLLIFLPAVLISAYDSSSPAFPMMYTAQKLNKQGFNIQPGRTPFPIWNLGHKYILFKVIVPVYIGYILSITLRWTSPLVLICKFS